LQIVHHIDTYQTNPLILTFANTAVLQMNGCDHIQTLWKFCTVLLIWKL